MKSQTIYSTVKTFPEFNRKIRETEAQLITLSYWLGTYTPIILPKFYEPKPSKRLKLDALLTNNIYAKTGHTHIYTALCPLSSS